MTLLRGRVLLNNGSLEGGQGVVRSSARAADTANRRKRTLGGLGLPSKGAGNSGR